MGTVTYPLRLHVGVGVGLKVPIRLLTSNSLCSPLERVLLPYLFVVPKLPFAETIYPIHRMLRGDDVLTGLETGF